MKALILSADNFEDTELLVPYYRLREEEIDVDIASMKKGTIKGKHGYEVEVDKSLKEVSPVDYDLPVLPGGKAPEALRKEKEAIAIARHFIDHPWVKALWQHKQRRFGRTTSAKSAAGA